MNVFETRVAAFEVAITLGAVSLTYVDYRRRVLVFLNVYAFFFRDGCIVTYKN